MISSIFAKERIEIASAFNKNAKAVVYQGDCIEFLAQIPNNSIQLIVTSPPYNIGKKYEKKTALQQYIRLQSRVISECVRVLKDNGSICWQVGNYADNGLIVPIDIVLAPVFWDLGLKMRNRIVWHFEHGLHCSKRLSGRYETIIWFTKTDDYVFDLDQIRIPQKYPGKKYFKGPKAGQYSCNPLGKNPGDVWIIPNVKSNHVEKTNHPCQFPVELIERLILALTQENEWVLDPYLGAGTSVVAAILNDRKGAGAEIQGEYVNIAKDRILQAAKGILPVRPRGRSVYDPQDAGPTLTTAPWLCK
jgi:adenine-specific DNA-methyltransferase